MLARSSSSERSRGRRAAVHSPASAGISARATPLMCRRTGLVSVPNRGSCANWATASTAPRTSRLGAGPLRLRRVLRARRVAAACASTAASTSPANGSTVARRRGRRRSAVPSRPRDDVAEALRGRRDGGPLPLGVRARLRAARGGGVLGGSPVLLGALDPLVAVAGVVGSPYGSDRARRRAAKPASSRRRQCHRGARPADAGSSARASSRRAWSAAARRAAGSAPSGESQQGLGGRLAAAGVSASTGPSRARGVPLGPCELAGEVGADLGGGVGGAACR